MKKSNLNRLEYFVAIAEEGTITAAAERMRISKAVVSKQLQLLEEELGATLVVRNSRHLNLTETGQSFYEAARASVAQAEEAYEMVKQGRAEPTGNLRITAPLDMGVTYVSPVVAEFRIAYPAVTIDLMLSDTRFDPVEARFDIAYRVGWLADSANIARKLADFQQIVVASPDLVELLGRPEHPERLAAFPFVEHRALPHSLSWKFITATGETSDVQMNPALRADVTPAIKAMVIEGAGISILPDFFAKREIENGTLIRLVPDWALPSGGIYAVYPPTQFRSAATKQFAGLFAERLRNCLA
ncbi:LysR family transcriptional regulator [Ruegeria sp. Alg231-54]|uniref:LysR family transcriptional regulator n=1 Tax=Ruegeria sp. Alg231-54 TaxID=1922221 RepID=UPI000D559222|nr:LysR family transcriptional regulator [Ruegeria sp. Alg231-54]